MSTTQMLTTDANTVKLWSMEAWEQVVMDTPLGYMFNRGIIHFADELTGKNARGDDLTFSYVGKSNQVPKGEGENLRNNAEALDLTSHSMKMNVSRLGYDNPNTQTIEQQRTHIKFDEQTRRVAADRAAEVLTLSLFNQLAGFNPTSFTGADGVTYDTTAKKLHVQGHNTPVAPSTNRIIRAASAASDQALTSSDTFKLVHIDYALEKNYLQTQRLQSLPGETFDLFLSPEQMVDLQHDTSGAIQWFNIELSRIQAGKGNAIDNPYKSNIVCAGKYKNVWIFQSPYVPYGVSGADSSVITTVRRAVLCGRGAVSFASPFGNPTSGGGVPIRFFEELVDLQYYKLTEGRLMYGMKKMIPTNKEDLGVTVISTYATAHS